MYHSLKFKALTLRLLLV